MEETVAEPRWRKEKARLAKLEKTRVRSRATVPGRGRGRPRQSDAERAAAVEKRGRSVQPRQETFTNPR